jgi:energy-coupling factor transporter ATP-binding protein EcfA2
MKRRQFLAGSAVATASGIAASAGSISATLDAASRASVVLHDRRITMDPAITQRLAGNGARVIALTDDPVRMWRSEVGTLLQQPDTRLFGVTLWADYLIVRGLAAESRRHVRHERHDPEAGTFTWLIA